MPTATDLAELARSYGVAADYLLGLTNSENGLPIGSAVLDTELIAALERAPDDAGARELLEARGHQVWFQIPEGASITSVRAAMERATPLLDRLRAPEV